MKNDSKFRSVVVILLSLILMFTIANSYLIERDFYQTADVNKKLPRTSNDRDINLSERNHNMILHNVEDGFHTVEDFYEFLDFLKGEKLLNE